jgi:hypothetical protein
MAEHLMLIPTVPAFITGDSSLVKMQQLAQCVAFLTSAQRYPMWHIYEYVHSSVVPFSGSTWTSMIFGFCAFDSDQMWDNHNTARVTVRTQGYFVCEACLPFISGGSGYAAQAAFLWTAGPANPHFSAGTTLQFGLKSGSVLASSNDEVLCIDDICPVVCYPGDFIAAQVWGSVAASINVGGPTSYFGGRNTANFTGRWLRTGS